MRIYTVCMYTYPPPLSLSLFVRTHTHIYALSVPEIFNRGLDWPHAISPGNPTREIARTLKASCSHPRVEAFIRDAHIFLSDI